ncbi:hypothetical protein [Halomicronema sp. CCY15110]|uniref:hypothetical protein n=1 Tax=Halomicronema sp. CCY15110 TaxID=2767773 RepID=UPI001952587B|nr:hypothetical protein [Halomicronema sp. CCY15110]
MVSVNKTKPAMTRRSPSYISATHSATGAWATHGDRSGTPSENFRTIATTAPVL